MKRAPLRRSLHVQCASFIGRRDHASPVGSFVCQSVACSEAWATSRPVIPGIPAMFAGMVKTSASYIWYGSSVRAPMPKVTVGEVGATMASTLSNASSKSRLISVRTF